MLRVMQLALAVFMFTAMALAAIAAGPSRPTFAEDAGSRQVWDNFRDGFSANGPNAKWFYFGAGPFVGDDGLVSTSQQGLSVVAPGRNPTTGEPAFTLTLAQEQDNGGLPGDLDHVKWLAYMNHTASTGYPGFDAVAGGALKCDTWIAGQTYGTAAQPFGAAVADPNDDLRLASVAMNVIDFESYMVFDFWLTNERIYAYYERLPFARPQLGDYASFSYAIPVATRRPGEQAHLSIGYDKAAGRVVWYVDDAPVFHVDRIGYRLADQPILIDHGGSETPVSPRQLDCGMGTFTLLDGAGPQHTALVRISSAPQSYFDTVLGPPALEPFLDDASLPSNRLFGQGAALQMQRYVVWH